MKGQQRGQGRRVPDPSAPLERLGRWLRCPFCLERVSRTQYSAHYDQCEERNTAQLRREAATRAGQGGPAGDDSLLVRCPLCKHRVWRVPDSSGGFRYEERAGRGPGELHLCDGAPSGGRHGRLLYVNPEIGIVEKLKLYPRHPQSNKSRKKRDTHK